MHTHFIDQDPATALLAYEAIAREWLTLPRSGLQRAIVLRNMAEARMTTAGDVAAIRRSALERAVSDVDDARDALPSGTAHHVASELEYVRGRLRIRLADPLADIEKQFKLCRRVALGTNHLMMAAIAKSRLFWIKMASTPSTTSFDPGAWRERVGALEPYTRHAWAARVLIDGHLRAARRLCDQGKTTAALGFAEDAFAILAANPAFDRGDDIRRRVEAHAAIAILHPNGGESLERTDDRERSGKNMGVEARHRAREIGLGGREPWVVRAAVPAADPVGSAAVAVAAVAVAAVAAVAVVAVGAAAAVERAQAVTQSQFEGASSTAIGQRALKSGKISKTRFPGSRRTTFAFITSDAGVIAAYEALHKLHVILVQERSWSKVQSEFNVDSGPGCLRRLADALAPDEGAATANPRLLAPLRSALQDFLLRVAGDDPVVRDNGDANQVMQRIDASVFQRTSNHFLAAYLKECIRLEGTALSKETRSHLRDFAEAKANQIVTAYENGFHGKRWKNYPQLGYSQILRVLAAEQDWTVKCLRRKVTP